MLSGTDIPKKSRKCDYLGAGILGGGGGIIGGSGILNVIEKLLSIDISIPVTVGIVVLIAIGGVGFNCNQKSKSLDKEEKTQQLLNDQSKSLANISEQNKQLHQQIAEQKIALIEYQQLKSDEAAKLLKEEQAQQQTPFNRIDSIRAKRRAAAAKAHHLSTFTGQPLPQAFFQALSSPEREEKTNSAAAGNEARIYTVPEEPEAPEPARNGFTQ